MSHFIGLVINTPTYLKNHTMDDALAPYDENREVPEYAQPVDDYEKVSFLEHYASNPDRELKIKKTLYKALVAEGKITDPANEDDPRYLNHLNVAMYDHKQRYADLFKQELPEVWAVFDTLYAAKGDNWNCGNWRKNIVTDVWESFSTYNPKSKWDWYAIGGRWSNYIKTKDGDYVDECLFGEMDWTPFTEDDYETETKTDFWGKEYHELKEGRKWHFATDNLPFCLIVDGQWIEKGEMGWWAIVANEKDDATWDEQVQAILAKIPDDADVTAVDFHI